MHIWESIEILVKSKGFPYVKEENWGKQYVWEWWKEKTIARKGEQEKDSDRRTDSVSI